MRVVMVSDVYFPRVNGVSTAIQTYRNSLHEEGVDVSLVAPDYGHSGSESWIRRVPARIVPGDPEDRLARWGAMHDAVEELVEEGCDLIHIQTPFVAHYAGLRSARRYGLPVIATNHTLFEEYLRHYAPLVPSSLLRGLALHFSRRQCNALDAVIVPSRAIRDRLVTYGVNAPMHVLPTGVSMPDSPAAGREDFRMRHGIDPARPVALFVGRAAHEKNIEFLLDVIVRVRETIPDVLLMIAGEGPALTSLKASVGRLALSGNVHFLGYMDRKTELVSCYKAADVFVFSSRTETQGLVLLEAMACGLPVVALAEMGTVDILESGRGAVVPDDNPEAFAMAVCRVLLDRELRVSLSIEGKIFSAEWSDSALAGRMAGFYRELVSGHVQKKAADVNLLPL